MDDKQSNCKHEKAYFEGHFSLIGYYRCEQCGAKIDPFYYHLMHVIKIAWDSPVWDNVWVMAEDEYQITMYCWGF